MPATHAELGRGGGEGRGVPHTVTELAQPIENRNPPIKLVRVEVFQRRKFQRDGLPAPAASSNRGAIRPITRSNLSMSIGKGLRVARS